MDAFEAIIAQALPGARIVASRPLKGGVSADVTLLEIECGYGSTRQCVLREHGVRHSGHPPKLEFQLLRALHDFGLPVARPLTFHSADASGAAPYVLSEYAAGSTAISASDADTRIDAMAWQLVAIHEAPTHALPTLPSRVDPQSELMGFLPDTTDWDPLRKRIAKLGPQPFDGAPGLLHGDYWPANIVWQDSRIAAVIDWEDAAVGVPKTDYASARLEMALG